MTGGVTENYDLYSQGIQPNNSDIFIEILINSK